MQQVWAIVSKEGRIDISSISWTRRGAIASWNDNPKFPWKYWRDKKGWRAAKITLKLAAEPSDLATGPRG